MSHPCPYCASELRPVYVITSGGIWYCNSPNYLIDFLRSTIDTIEQLKPDPDNPMTCIIGNLGYRSGSWPKQGMYCIACGTLIMKTVGGVILESGNSP
jgi:hypothetical protein